MAIGLLAGLAYAGIGAMEGANKLSAKEKELTDRTDELSQKASDVRMTAEHKRLATKWDENDAVIKAVGKSGYTTRSGQYRLAKHAGDVSSLEEFDSLRGDTVWELPKQGARPELNFADVTKLRAKRRTGADYLSQAVGLSDQETYTGSSVVERERELLKLDSVSYRRATDEDKASVLERRATEKRLSDLSKGVKQRFLEYKNNLAHHPRIAAEVEGLEGKELDSKLLSLAFNIDNIDVTTTGTVDKKDVYFKSLNIDDTGITLQLTNTEDATVNKINGQINAASNQITISNDPATNAKIKTKIKALEEQKATHIKDITAHKQKVDAHVVSLAKPDAEAENKEHSGIVHNFHKDMPGVDDDMLLLTETKAKERGTPFTATGEYLYDVVTKNVNRVLEFEKKQAYTSAKYNIGNITWKNIQEKSVKDIKARTIPVSSGVTGDSVFVIPHEFVPYGTEITPALKRQWKMSVDGYVNTAQESDTLYTTDDDVAGYVLDFQNNLRETYSGTPPPTEEVTTSTSKIDVAVEPVGTIRNTSKGKLIKTTKGWIPYSDSDVSPNIPPAPVVEESQEVPVHQQIADIKLAAHNAESDIKQQASLDLQAATKQTSKDAIAEAAKASIAKLRSKLKNDLAQFTGN